MPEEHQTDCIGDRLPAQPDGRVEAVRVRRDLGLEPRLAHVLEARHVARLLDRQALQPELDQLVQVQQQRRQRLRLLESCSRKAVT